MALEPLSEEPLKGESQPVVSDFKDRTFMGGIGVQTRSSLFIMLGLVVLGAAGFGLFYADKELKKADLMLDHAIELNAMAADIERDIWRIRAESTSLSQHLVASDPATSDAEIAATQEHVALGNSVGQRLDEIYQRADAAPISEQVSTLREAIAQYVEKYDQKEAVAATPSPDLSQPEITLRQTMRAMGQVITDVNILSLNETMITIRGATTAFIETGMRADLTTIEEQQKELVHLLTSVPTSDENKKDIGGVFAAFRTALAAYSKIRLVEDNTVERLAEILSYMAPSLDTLTGFAGDNLMQAGSYRDALREQFRIYIAAGVAGALMVMMLFGLAMLRSINAPIVGAAKASRNLQSGHTDFVVWGLGNEDETGDIARGFSVLKGRLAEANKLRDGMKKAKAEAERGRAASEEAEWLRRDLESMKAEADKGQEALAEVALLRKIIDATSDNISQKQAVDEIDQANKQERPSEIPVPRKPAPELTLDSISSISRQVAQSSESVTAAADEAERTGTLIRNLSDASEKIDAIEALIAAIGEQADMLVVNTPDQGPDTNLVILNGDGERGDAARLDGIGRRFDAIRSAAGQATWAVRDIGSLIKDSREVALTIARLSSTEALEVTTDLLQQSENLRGMLDSLVNRMQDQIADDAPEQESENEGPTSA